jgi:hypothetical protein
MPPPINNIMADVDFFRACPNQITIEQGRKVRYNVVNDSILFNCLTSSSTMTFNGYINIPAADYEITTNEVWNHPAVFTNLINPYRCLKYIIVKSFKIYNHITSCFQT